LRRKRRASAPRHPLVIQRRASPLRLYAAGVMAPMA
jgi:hypothetical protein